MAPHICASPAWAPDGSGLIYLNTADAKGQFQLWGLQGAATIAKPPVQMTSGLDLDATSVPAWAFSVSRTAGERVAESLPH